MKCSCCGKEITDGGFYNYHDEIYCNNCVDRREIVTTIYTLKNGIELVEEELRTYKSKKELLNDLKTQVKEIRGILESNNINVDKTLNCLNNNLLPQDEIVDFIIHSHLENLRLINNLIDKIK